MTKLKINGTSSVVDLPEDTPPLEACFADVLAIVNTLAPRGSTYAWT